MADFIHMVGTKAEAASMAKAGAEVASMDQHPNQITLVVAAWTTVVAGARITTMVASTTLVVGAMADLPKPNWCLV